MRKFYYLLFVLLMSMAFIRHARACPVNFEFMNIGPNAFMFNAFNSDSSDFGFYEWDFGDGKFAEGLNVQHIYQNPGIYDVQLKYFSSQNMDTCIFLKQLVIETTPSGCYAGFGFYKSSPEVAPLAFQFNNYSTSAPGVKYHWTFGDFKESNEFAPWHVYTDTGFYNVCLKVWDSVANCFDSTCQMVYVQNEQINMCKADFGWQTSFDNNMNVNFINYASKTPTTKYRWTFGDGTESDLEYPSHLYLSKGIYNVCIEIIDSVNNCYQTTCRDVQVGDIVQPNCSAGFGYWANNNLEYHFENNSSYSYGAKFHWTFGDSTQSNDFSPIHVYADSGMYQVCVTVWDTINNCSDSKCEMVYVGMQKPYECFANFSWNNDYNNQLQVYFQNYSAQSSTAKYHWTFGDGAESMEPFPMHVYTTQGEYNVCLHVKDSINNCDQNICYQVYAGGQTEPKCFAGFSFYLNNPDNPYTFQFNNYSMGDMGKSYHWSFGDSTESSEAMPLHVYADSGMYQVCLHVFDSVNNCSDTQCEMVYVGVQKPYECFANFSWNNDYNNQLQVYFQNYSAQSPTAKYHWTFGDGAESMEPFPTHVYTTQGEYNVCLHVKDSINNCDQNICYQVYAGGQTEPKCFAGFSFYMNNPNDSYTYQFNNYSMGDTGKIYHWTFGDSTESTEAMPMHVFADSGMYQVCLQVFDSVNNCTDTKCEMVYVGMQKPYECFANFGWNNDYNNPLQVNFQNYSAQSSTAKFHWTFGDGAESMEPFPTHVYTTQGEYNVCLHLKDSVNNCELNICNNVYVGGQSDPDCYAGFNWYNEGAMSSLGIRFEKSNTNSNSRKFHWEFGDGMSSNEMMPIHYYNKPGNYQVCLTIEDSLMNCFNQQCMNIYVGEYNGHNDCSVAAYWEPLTTEPNVIRFKHTDASASTKFHWVFGDGTESNESEPIHRYAKYGEFKVQVFISDSVKMCSSEQYLPVMVGYIQTNPCQADFGWNKSDNDNLMVYFDMHSLYGPEKKYIWHFGDGGISYNPRADHRYNAPGEYTVCHIVMDSVNNCIDSICRVINVGNQYEECDMNAYYTYKVDSSGKTVFFNNFANIDFAQYKWHFGDGQMSEGYNPIHTYADTGTYFVCLTIFTESCSRDFCQPIRITKTTGDGCLIYAGEDLTVMPGTCVDLHAFTNKDAQLLRWSNGMTGENIRVCPPVTSVYKVNVVDAAGIGCEDEVKVYVATENDHFNCQAQFNYALEPQSTNTFRFKNYSLASTTAEYRWNFGDGIESNMYSPIHVYQKPGTYRISMILIDSLNNSYCSDTAYDMVYIPEIAGNCNIEAYFNYEAFIDSSNNTAKVKFNNFVNIPFAQYNWSFGDGNHSQLLDPIHTYATSGKYDVCLYVKTMEGCTDTVCMPVYAGIQDTSCVVRTGSDIVVRQGDCVTLYAEGNMLNYEWSDNQAGNMIKICPEQTMDYVVYGSKNNRMCSDTIKVMVEQAEVECFAKYGWKLDSMNRQMVKFSNLTLPGAYKYMWHFGDGNMSNEKSPIYTYKYAGNYTVCLSITDTVNNCENSVCNIVKIERYNPCDVFADYNAVKDQNGLGIQFDNNASNFVNVNWNFGDGQFSKEVNPHHVYNYPGTYEVCLTVYGQNTDCVQKICKTITVREDRPIPTCIAEFDYQIDGQNVQFLNYSSQYTNIRWKFGDGTSSVDNSPLHKFVEGGMYTVCMDIFDSLTGCQQQICKLIAIKTNQAYCNAEFTYVYDNDTTITVAPNMEYATNSMKYAWTFGNGDYAHTPTAQVKYLKSGVYDVCLFVYDTLTGCQAQTCQRIVIGNNTCNADFNFFVGDDNQTVTFTDASSGVNSWYWNFGNGLTSTEQNPKIQFANAGSFKVTLSVKNTETGCISYITKLIVIADSYCEAGFTYYANATSAFNTIQFKNTSVGSADQYFWSFGDGTVSNSENPFKVYTYPGVYKVCLGILNTNTNCFSEICQEIQVGDVACKANFAYYIDNTSNTINFKNSSEGNISKYFWEFGDGAISILENPSHTYLYPGYYTVKLKVFNSITGCMDVREETVLINELANDCQAEFAHQIDLTNNTVNFFDKSLAANTTQKIWYFGDGQFSSEQNPQHQFTTAGIYQVCLSIYDQTTGCYNTACDKIQVSGEEAFCSADFNFDLNNEINEVKFYDKSQGNPNTWIWEFGDNQSSLSQNPVHTYSKDSLYLVKLVVVKPGTNCKSFDYDLVYTGDLTTLLGSFAFEIDTNNQKTNTYPVDFYGVSKGNPAKWVWDFGDGTKDSTSVNPRHEYQEKGEYNVCLTISDPVINQSNTSCMLVKVGDSATNIAVVKSASINVFPNPNNGNAHIVYTLPSKDRVDIKVYDLLGNLITRLVDEEQSVGIHTLNWNNDLPSGIYMVRLQTSKEIINHKVVINK